MFSEYYQLVARLLLNAPPLRKPPNTSPFDGLFFIKSLGPHRGRRVLDKEQRLALVGLKVRSANTSAMVMSL